MPTKQHRLSWALRGFGLTFTVQWLPTVLLLLGLPLLIALGNWQLSRAAYKQYLIDQLQEGQKQVVPLFHALALRPLADLHNHLVQVTGHYDAMHTVFLDNQMAQHQVGYAVLTPFIASGGSTEEKVFLVNRGWIPKGALEQPAAMVPVSGQQTISGLLQVLPRQAFTLGQPVVTRHQQRFVQSLDRHIIQALYPQPLSPFVLLLSPSAADGFLREWHPVILTPARHRAYAIQWFALAATLVIMYFILSVQRDSYGTKGSV